MLNPLKPSDIPPIDPRKWQKMLQAKAPANLFGGSAPSSSLYEVYDFGSNPGALRMFTYVPPDLAPASALVVVLHGCTQTAAGYDFGAGWSTLADRYGFALVFPEQQKSNNPNGCFNWFLPGDTGRDGGEALSIRQMVARAIADYNLDGKRVFVTGLSAGGAMTSVMLATYPDVFAGGGIVAGLPYGAAGNVQQAFESMYQSPPRPARAWGDLVRTASPHSGPWPRVSVWHGSSDATVIPANAIEIVKQWTDVLGLPGVPSRTETVDGYPRQVWCDGDGDELIESYTITSMTHGTPLAVGSADDQCGAAGPFLLDVGISSSYHIAKFWGLAERPCIVAGEADATVAVTNGRINGEGTSETREETHTLPRPAGLPGSGPVDVRGIITRALKAAGLMKAT